MDDYISYSKTLSKQQNDSTTSMKKTLASYIKNESDMIENEINEHVKKFLKRDDRYKAFRILQITKWKLLKYAQINQTKKDIFVNKKDITEFDGLFVITTDDTYYPDESIIVRGKKQTNTGSKTPYISRFVIVEAKHSITNSDIDDKLEQMEELQKYLLLARQRKPQIGITSPHEDNFTIEFDKKIINYDLERFDTNLTVIFGSDDMGENQERKIRNDSDIWKNKGIQIGYIKPSGNRYELYHSDDDFQANNLAYTNVKANTVDSKSYKIGSGATKNKVRNVKNT